MTVSLLIDPISSIWNNTGSALAGSIEIYDAGTNTAATTYSDSAGTISNDNPLPLTAGRATIYGTDGTAYKIVLKDSSGAILKTLDDVYTQDGQLRADLGATLPISVGPVFCLCKGFFGSVGVVFLLCQYL